MKRFSPEREYAIEEKIELFWPAFKHRFYPDKFKVILKEIEEKITQKRLNWFEENKNRLWYLKRDDLVHIDKAACLLFGEYMKIPFKELKIKGERAIFQKLIDEDHGRFIYEFHSRNFCPYLEAFKRLRLKPEESIDMCRLVLHKPSEELAKRVDSRIRFVRDYNGSFYDGVWRASGIRPLNDYCFERLVIEDGDLIFKVFYEDEFRKQGLL